MIAFIASLGICSNTLGGLGIATSSPLVEDDQYGYDINGILVTDFVTPAWFGFKNESGPVDFQQHAKNPFEVLSNGYAQKFLHNGWQQINGDKIAASGKKRALSAAEGSRRQRRAKKRSEWISATPWHFRNQARMQLRIAR